MDERELEQAEECHYEAICQNCGREVDNPAQDCKCPCHSFV